MALSRGNVPARVTVLAAALVLGLLLAPTATTATASAAAATVAEPLCPPAQAGYARCAAEILVDAATGAPIHPAGLTAAPADQPSSPPPATGSPAWLGWAYDLQELSMLAPPVPDTVAIVDPYGDSAAESDLATYRSQFDLPACTTANGCFEKVDQAGGTNYPPDPTPSSGNDDWITETSLDLDMVSAICPYCHILLVQANTAADSDLAAAEETAEQTPAPFDPQQISNSWSWTGDFTHDAAFDDSGLAVVAATGDGGYNTFGIPAELPWVTAAGGTSLPAASDARGFAETAWSGTASGCSSAVFAKPTWQTDSACPFRTLADLSADADVSTGALAYDSIVDHGFYAAGGTSVASPIIAAYFALVGGGAGDGGAAWAYAHANTLNDITSGSDGSCTPPASDLYLCTAQAGYDGPTGEGSVSGDAVAGPPQPAGAFAQVNGTDATLSGGVYANQFDTQTLFQYGTSTAYGQSTPPAYAGQALGVTPVGVTVTGLSPSTAYHFRLVATNGCGTSYGYDATFTAGSGAPTSTTTTTTTTTTSTATTTRLPCPTAATWSSSTSTTTTGTSTATVTSTSAPPAVSTAQSTTVTASAPLTTMTTTTTRTATTAAIPPLKVRIGPAARHRGGRVRVRASCNRRCAGSLTLRVDGRLIGRATIALRSRGFSAVVTVRLNALGRRLARAHDPLAAVAAATLNGHLARQAIVIR